MSASPRHVASGLSPGTLTVPSSASYAPGSPTMATRHRAPALNTQGAGGQVRARAAHTTWPISPARPPARPRDGRASRGTAYHPPHHRRRRHRPFFSCPRRPRYRRRRPRRTRSRYHRPRSCHRRPHHRHPRPRRRHPRPRRRRPRRGRRGRRPCRRPRLIYQAWHRCRCHPRSHRRHRRLGVRRRRHPRRRRLFGRRLLVNRRRPDPLGCLLRCPLVRRHLIRRGPR
jgi:hypothetical protein